MFTLATPLVAWIALCGAPFQDGAAPPKATGAQDEAYANTPAELRPYARFPHVFWRYFRKPLEYLGPGRDEPGLAPLESFKIGLLAPLEGRGETAIGKSLHEGVLLAFEEANARGGFQDRAPFEIVLRNDAAIWGDSSNTVVELSYREKVWAILGSVDASSTHVALRVALKAEIGIVNTACTDPTLTETGIPWILRCYPDDRQHGYELARLSVHERGLQRVAMLRTNDKYGRMGVKEFSDAARRLGHPVVLEQRFYAGDTSFDEQLARVREVGADALVLWGDSADCGRIVARMRALGMKQPVFGNDRLVTSSFLATAGAAAEGVIATSAMDPQCSAPAWLAFRERYRTRFGGEPDAFATYSYDGARILLAAAQRAGANRARIRDELFATTEFAGTCEPMHFDNTANNLGRLYALEFHDGRFVRIPGR